MLLWLWRRLAAAAPIQPLVWKLPDAMGVALKDKRKKKKEKKKKKKSVINIEENHQETEKSKDYVHCGRANKLNIICISRNQ